MNKIAPSVRQLPTHHVTIRVPWHDSGWTGTICEHPLDNTSCLILPRIGEGRQDDVEERCAGKRLDELTADKLPPCCGERVSFMSPFELARTMTHPYSTFYPDTHGHFASTRFVQMPYSAACLPFRWMLREKVEGNQKEGEIGLAERLQLGWVPEREPEIRNKNGKVVETSWVQERENQLALLDTFFGAIKPEESLCFFYAKKTPLSEQSKRVIIGVGRVLSVGAATEYAYAAKKPPLRCVLWERNVGHSIRPGFEDGFLFPYQAIIEMIQKGEIDNPEDLVCFAPDDHFSAYSYGSELLTHDGAVASLVACAAVLNRLQGRVEGSWDKALKWINSQLNRLWKARGAYPGLGSALSAFGYEWGFQHGSLLAYEIELMNEKSGNDDPWKLVDAIFQDVRKCSGPTAKLITPGLCKGWKFLGAERKALLKLISRCAVNENQALRFYDKTERKDSGIDKKDGEFIANPYLLYELDRRSLEPIAFSVVDRGLFPDETLRKKFPLPRQSLVDDPADSRRVRAFVVDILESASTEGHTLLPQSWVIRQAREKALQPSCPLGESVLAATEPDFAPVVSCVSISDDESAYQLSRLAECRDIIRREVRGRKSGKLHAASYNWRALVDQGIGNKMPTKKEDKESEERARQEKAVALEQIYRSRLAVLIGSAGTGKTTLLKMLCTLPEVSDKGILLLAPTGKARVRLEEKTGQRGAGKTIAQFLNTYNRYDGETCTYFINRNARRCNDYRTVIIDECSMLTEDQLAALFDACSNVERYVLVGDPRQLPPIGAGRPFVDIVNELAPKNIEALFPRCLTNYAELTIPRRQTAQGQADVLLAAHFAGLFLDPGADEVWSIIASGASNRLRTVEWSDPQDLQQKLLNEIVSVLKLAGPDDELGFELSLGGSRLEGLDRAFFWNCFGNNPGAAAMVDAWQILSPIHHGLEGVDAVNRTIQEKFRSRWRYFAELDGWNRTIPKPFGSQRLLYGDKVINIINKNRYDIYPKIEGNGYVVNGDIGMVIGQYKTKKFKGLPWKIEVEFAGQLGTKYGFSKKEFGDEAVNPLELAYALTVHKTQGSEFGVTFVILPNPCWLLTRELLYTALTRHRDLLVIMHQGPLAEFRRFSNVEYSEIARRMTNLFKEPSPKEIITVKGSSKFLEEGLIHRTERGELVRSKSELIIADKLHARGIDYVYEQPLKLNMDQLRYPDFTIADHARGITFYWEHLGMLNDPEYRARWERKRSEYLSSEIKPYKDGGGSEGVLIETSDDAKGGLDAANIAKIIDEVVLS